MRNLDVEKRRCLVSDLIFELHNRINRTVSAVVFQIMDGDSIESNLAILEASVKQELAETLMKVRVLPMSKHTPGPWYVGDGSAQSNHEGDDCVIALREGSRITTLVKANNWFGEESKANACLIAAAPELLDELRDAAAYLQSLRSLERERNEPTGGSLDIKQSSRKPKVPK